MNINALNKALFKHNRALGSNRLKINHNHKHSSVHNDNLKTPGHNDSVNDKITREIISTSRQVEKEKASRLNKYQQGVLALVAQQDGAKPLSNYTVAQCFKISNSYASSIIHRLYNIGLIDIEGKTRSRLIKITSEGDHVYHMLRNVSSTNRQISRYIKHPSVSLSDNQLRVFKAFNYLASGRNSQYYYANEEAINNIVKIAKLSWTRTQQALNQLNDLGILKVSSRNGMQYIYLEPSGFQMRRDLKHKMRNGKSADGKPVGDKSAKAQNKESHHDVDARNRNHGANNADNHGSSNHDSGSYTVDIGTGLTKKQSQVLKAIARHARSTSAGSVSYIRNRDISSLYPRIGNVSQIIKMLDSQHLIRKEIHNRHRSLYLTPKGRRLVKGIGFASTTKRPKMQTSHPKSGDSSTSRSIGAVKINRPKQTHTPSRLIKYYSQFEPLNIRVPKYPYILIFKRIQSIRHGLLSGNNDQIILGGSPFHKFLAKAYSIKFMFSKQRKSLIAAMPVKSKDYDTSVTKIIRKNRRYVIWSNQLVKYLNERIQVNGHEFVQIPGRRIGKLAVFNLDQTEPLLSSPYSSNNNNDSDSNS